jgi:hypothetical protein
VTEERIKAYSESQGEEDQVFQVWDETKLPNEPDGSSSVSVSRALALTCVYVELQTDHPPFRFRGL